MACETEAETLAAKTVAYDLAVVGKTLADATVATLTAALNTANQQAINANTALTIADTEKQLAQEAWDACNNQPPPP